MGRLVGSGSKSEGEAEADAGAGWVGWVDMLMVEDTRKIDALALGCVGAHPMLGHGTGHQKRCARLNSGGRLRE